MRLAIKHEAFTNRGLGVHTAGVFKGPRLMIDGREAKGKRLRFSVRDNSGNQREIRLRTNMFDPIPKVEIGDQTIQLARPLAWYEYAWMAIPIVLGLSGGALGAMFGFGALYASSRIFRSDRGAFAKYALSALISLGAAVAFFVSVGAIHLLVGVPSRG